MKMGINTSRNGDSVNSTLPNQDHESKARKIFETGTKNCPRSIHLWHAWAMHEQSLGNIDKSRELLDKALELDRWNGYVCHSYGMLEMQCGDRMVGWIKVMLYYF